MLVLFFEQDWGQVWKGTSSSSMWKSNFKYVDKSDKYNK